MEKKPCSGKLTSVLKSGGGGDGDDGGDDWNESGEGSESEDDEMGFDLFDDVEMDLVPTSIDSQIKQPKVSKDRLGSIFRAQQLVRCSLTV